MVFTVHMHLTFPGLLRRVRRQTANEVATRLVAVSKSKPELLSTAVSQADPDLLRVALTDADPKLLEIALTKATPELLGTALTQGVNGDLLSVRKHFKSLRGIQMGGRPKPDHNKKSMMSI